MRILVLSYYFRPDLSAGSFRMTPFVDALRRLAPAGTEIDVVTTRPHRYHTFSAEAPERERHGGVTITRIPLPPHEGGMLDQSRAFATFARRATRIARGEYDLVFATSSRLLTAALGAWIARRARAPLYLDIRDIFADTIKDVLRGPSARVARPLFSALERWTVRRASRVNLVSRGFLSYFESRYPRQRFSFHTNGIDEEFLAFEGSAPACLQRDGNGERQITALYAGNIGDGQGLHVILPPLAQRMGARVRFLVVGDGGRRAALERSLKAHGVTTVEIRPPVERPQLLELYRAADVLFLHLNDYDAFRKVLPSKIFEYAAVGKPIWGGVAGHAAEFLRAEVSNAGVFDPCDVDGAERAFLQLVPGHTPRPEFIARFARAAISERLAADVLSVAGATS
jgi:glycosyltransferase involved in cell wall biosynthesis